MPDTVLGSEWMLVNKTDAVLAFMGLTAQTARQKISTGCGVTSDSDQGRTGGLRSGEGVIHHVMVPSNSEIKLFMD